VTEADIAEVISRWTGIPVTRLVSWVGLGGWGLGVGGVGCILLAFDFV